MGRWAEPQRVNEALRAQPYSCAILAGYEPSESDRSRLQIDQTRTVQRSHKIDAALVRQLDALG